MGKNPITFCKALDDSLLVDSLYHANCNGMPNTDSVVQWVEFTEGSGTTVSAYNGIGATGTFTGTTTVWKRMYVDSLCDSSACSGLYGRTYTSSLRKNGYRYAFNGKEHDPDWNGEGAMYDYGFRIYDPRLVRFLSVDPLTRSYPWYTPYQFAGNKPIVAIDMDGLEEYIVSLTYDSKGRVTKLAVSYFRNGSCQIINMNLENSNGQRITNKNVLIIHNYSNGTHTYKEQDALSTAQSALLRKKLIIKNGANEGYKFDGYTGDGINSDGSFEFAIESYSYPPDAIDKTKAATPPKKTIVKPPAPSTTSTPSSPTPSTPVYIPKTYSARWGTASAKIYGEWDNFIKDKADYFNIVEPTKDIWVTIPVYEVPNYILSPYNWSDKVPGKSFSYEELRNVRFKVVKDALIKNGVDPSRIHQSIMANPNMQKSKSTKYEGK